jgi:hypothetical protein
MKSREIPHTKKSETTKKPDLRHGMHGTLTTHTIDAGQSSLSGDTDAQPASPDFSVPTGQTTHE